MAQSLTKQTTIQRSPEQIHDWLTSWDNIKAWMGPTLVSIDMLSDHQQDEPMCSGMRFRETRKMGKMNAKAVIEVERHELVDGVLHHRAVFDDGCNRMIAEYEYAPSGEGTSATWTMSNAPSKWWSRAISPVMGPMMIKMINKCDGDHLDRLKGLIEGED
jgi:uncharacterized protein YndB with AHSA1/START domain